MNKKMDEPRPQNPNEVGAAPEAGEGSSQAETRKSQEAAKRKNSQREVHSAEIRAKGELTKHAKNLGLDPNLRDEAIRDQLRSQQVEIEGKKVSLDEGLVKLAKAIAKDETSPEHTLFEGLDLSVKNLQDNPSIAWVILKTASLDGVSRKPKLLLQLSLEAAHRGGGSKLAQEFRNRLHNRLVELYEQNPQAVEKEYLDKVGEIADRVEQFPKKSIEWYGREEDGKLSKQGLKDFRNKPEEGEEFTDKLAKLTKPEPAGAKAVKPKKEVKKEDKSLQEELEEIKEEIEEPKFEEDHPELTKLLKELTVEDADLDDPKFIKKVLGEISKIGRSDSESRDEAIRTLKKILRNTEEIRARYGFDANDIQDILDPNLEKPGFFQEVLGLEYAQMPPRPTRERRGITADQLRSELQLRTLTNLEIERIYYGGEEVAEEFVFDLILQAGANPKGRFEFDLSKMYQMSEIEKILRYKETETIGEETKGEILASRFASNIEDYRSFHTANQLVFYASTSLEEQLKILTKVLTPEHLDVLKDVDYGPEALQLYEKMLYQILADKLVEFQRIEEKARKSMTDEKAPSLTDEEYRTLQRGVIIEPEDLIPSSPEWNKLYRRDRAFKMLSMDIREIVKRATSSPATQESIKEKEETYKLAFKALREAQTSGSDTEKAEAFKRFRKAVEELESERSKDVEREQAEHDLAFIKEMKKEFASQIRREMQKDKNIDENEALRRAVKLNDRERREFEAGAFFSENEAEIRSLLRAQARVDLEREYSRGGLQGEELKNKIDQALAREDYKIRRALFHARTFYITTVRLPSINANVGIMPTPVSEPALAAPTQEDLLRVLNYEAFMLHRFDYFGQDYTENLSHVLLVLRFQKMAGDLKIDDTNEWRKTLKMRAETTEEVKDKAEAMQKILQEKTGIDYTMLVRGHLTPIGGLFDDTGWRLGLSVLNKLRELVGLEESQKFAQGTRLINLGDEISNELMSIDRRTIEEMKNSDRVEDRARAKIYDEYIKVRYSSDPKDKEKAKKLKEKLVKGFEYEEKRRGIKTKHNIMGIEAEKKQEIFRTIAERTPSFIINFFPRQAQLIIKKRLESNLGGNWEDNRLIWQQFERALSLAESEATNRLIDDIDFEKLIVPYLQQIANVEEGELMNNERFAACVEALEEVRGYFSENGAGRNNLEHLASFNFPLTLLLYDVPWKHVKFTEMGAGAAIDRRLGREIPSASKGNHAQGDMLTDPSPIEIDKLKERVVEYVGVITGYKGRDAELLGDMLQRLALDFNIHRHRRSYGWIPGWERAAVWYTWTENPTIEKIKNNKILGPLVSKLFPSPSKAVEYFGEYAPAWMEGEVKWYTEGIRRAGAWAKHRGIPYSVQKDFQALTPDLILAFGREAMPKIMLLMFLIALADALRDK